MFDRRTKNVEIFRDTCQAIKESKTLQNAVTNSIKEQKLFIEGKDCNYDIKNLKRDAMCRVVVSGKRTFYKNEKGITSKNLERIFYGSGRKFYLSWSHYLKLMRIEDIGY